MHFKWEYKRKPWSVLSDSWNKRKFTRNPSKVWTNSEPDRGKAAPLLASLSKNSCGRGLIIYCTSSLQRHRFTLVSEQCTHPDVNLTSSPLWITPLLVTAPIQIMWTGLTVSLMGFRLVTYCFCWYNGQTVALVWTVGDIALRYAHSSRTRIVYVQGKTGVRPSSCLS